MMLAVLTRQFLLVITILGLLLPNMANADHRDLLIYCGITMVKPISEMAKQFERKHGIKITISQGGSDDLYKSLKTSQKGDIYLPGVPYYRNKHLDEALLGDYKVIGYNQAAIFVRKGNPKQVTADLKQFLRSDLTLLIAAENQGSIGIETKRILTQAGIYEKVIDNAAIISPDSRTINASLKQGEADITINWRATAYFTENSPHIDVIDLPTNVALPQALLMNLITISQQKQLAQAFIDFAASSEGQIIMRKHGFLDNNTVLNAI